MHTKIETKRHLSDRFGRSTEKALNHSTALSDHFGLPSHSIKDMELIPLELINSLQNSIRKAREGILISKSNTLEPYGIKPTGLNLKLFT